MKRWFVYTKRLLIVGLMGAALITGACEGTDTRNAVDDTVEELAGKKHLDRYHNMKDTLSDVERQQEHKQDQLDESQDN